MILLIAGIGLVVASTILAIVMLVRHRENDAPIDAEQKAPVSAEPAGTRARPQVNAAPPQEPQRAPAEPYDKEAAKATLESFVPSAEEGTHKYRPSIGFSGKARRDEPGRKGTLLRMRFFRRAAGAIFAVGRGRKR